MDIQLLTI